MAVLRKALLLLLLIPLSQACTPLLGNLTDSRYGPYLAVGVLLTAAVLAILYMYAKLSQDRKLLVMVKDSVIVAVTTLAIVAGAEGATLFFCHAYTYITGEPLGDLVEESWAVAESYDNIFRLYLTVLEKERLSAAALTAYTTVITFPNLLFTPGSLSMPTYPEGEVFYTLYTARSASILNYLLGSIYIHKALLFFLKHFWIDGLFVAAFILRLFPFTRNAGNVLLILYFAMAYVFPFLYATSGKMFTAMADSAFLTQVCSDIQRLSQLPHRELPTPYGCSQPGGIAHLGVLTLFAVWMPSLTLGITLQFASAFKRILEFEVR